MNDKSKYYGSTKHFYSFKNYNVQQLHRNTRLLPRIGIAVTDIITKHNTIIINPKQIWHYSEYNIKLKFLNNLHL